MDKTIVQPNQHEVESRIVNKYINYVKLNDLTSTK